MERMYLGRWRGYAETQESRVFEHGAEGAAYVGAAPFPTRDDEGEARRTIIEIARRAIGSSGSDRADV